MSESPSSLRSDTLARSSAPGGLALVGGADWVATVGAILEPLGAPLLATPPSSDEGSSPGPLAQCAGAFVEGWEEARRLRQIAPGRRVPIVVIRSAPPGPADLERARALAPVDLLDHASSPEAYRAKAEFLLEMARGSSAGSGGFEPGELAYAVGHDLRAPLRRIVSFLELIQRRYKGRLGPDADEYIGFVMEGGDQLGRLLDDLHAYFKLAGASAPLERVDLDDVLAKVLAARRVQIERAGASVHRPRLPAVRGAAASLARLFDLLLDNSLKFRAERPLEIDLEVEEARASWIFRFRDNGIGFDPTHSGRVFEVFQRLHPRSEYAGNGIGLSLGRLIVLQHGGSIWADAVPGEGVTIGFTLRKP